MSAKRSIFYDDDSANVAKAANVSAEGSLDLHGVDRALFFDLERTAQLVTLHSFKRIALQFPDSLLSYSSFVVQVLEGACPDSEFYILADTSYGEDGVDEVAAEHSNADLIVHYGRAAFENPRKTPVLFVPGRGKFDVADFVSQFVKQFSSSTEKLIVFADGLYTFIMEELKSSLCNEKSYKNILFTKVKLAKKMPNESISNDFSSTTHFDFCGRYLDDKMEGEKKDYKVLFLGGECTTLTNIALSFNQSEIYSYNPSTSVLRRESLAVNKLLQRRYVLVEKAKDANIIGILVGTLAVDKYLSVIEYMKKIIKESDKKYYVFVVGKLNIAKLANFPDIDMFVLVAGAEHSLIDSRGYFRPIITPFELEMALVSGKEWTLDYVLDFATLLEKRDDLIQVNDMEETRVSLITGRVIEKRNMIASNDNSLVPMQNNSEVTKYEASTLFLQKSFKGLEQKLGETPVVLAVEGRSGIPFVGYQGEGGKESDGSKK